MTATEPVPASALAMRRAMVISQLIGFAVLPAATVDAQVELLPPNRPADELPADGLPADGLPADGLIVPEPGIDRAQIPTKPVATPTPTGSASDPDAQVRVGDLPAVSPDAVGTLDPTSSGFGPDLWQQSDRARIEKLIPHLPLGARSPAMRGLVRRLMLSAAPPPGQAGTGNWLELRLSALLGVGDWEAVGELAALIPESAKTARIAEIEADARLLAGDNAGACESVSQALRGQAALYWRAALPFCQIRAGELAPAALSRDLLRAEEAALAPGYMAMLALLLKESDALGAVEIAPRPLHVALLVAAGAPAPDSWWRQAGPGVMRALARADKLDAGTRLVAGEHAAAQGSLTADDLARLYRGMTFKAEELADAEAAAAERGGAFGRALLVQASAQELPADQRARLLTAVWRAAEAVPGFAALARATGDSLAAIAPDSTLVWFAGDALRAAIATGRNDVADRWLALLAGGAGVDPVAGGGLDRIAPLAAAALPDGGWPWQSAMAVRYWRALPASEDDDGAARWARAARQFVTLDALGYDIGGAWDLLLDGPLYSEARIPSDEVRYALRDAAQAGRVGETVLLALLAIGPDGPSGADPLALAAAIRTLRAVGAESDARALALEAMIANG